MGQFLVQKVKQVDSGTDKNGKPWTKAKIRLWERVGDETIQRDVLLYCPQWNPPPAEGSTLEGEIGKPFREGQLPEFERPRTSIRNGFSGPKQTHPRDAARMGRAHAQDMALRYIECKARLGKVDDFSLDDLWKLVDTFDRDVKAAEKST